MILRAEEATLTSEEMAEPTVWSADWIVDNPRTNISKPPEDFQMRAITGSVSNDRRIVNGYLDPKSPGD